MDLNINKKINIFVSKYHSSAKQKNIYYVLSYLDNKFTILVFLDFRDIILARMVKPFTYVKLFI